MPNAAKKRGISLLIAAILLCSACDSGGNVSFSSETSAYETVAVPTTVISSSETTAEKVTSTEAENEVAVDAETSTISSEEATSSFVTSTSLSSSEIVSETTTAASSTTATTTAAVTVTTTTTASSEQIVSDTTESEVITETSVPAAEFPPAEIKVKKINSPGTDVEKTETSVIDYSNASKGYISASYSGSSARAKLRIVCNGITCDHDLAVTGEAEYFPLMQGSGDYRIQIYEQLEGKMYSNALDLSVTLNIKDEVGMYLYPNRYSMFSENSACVKKSAEICGGAEDEIGKIAAIFIYITDNITYDYDLAATVKSGYIPDPDSVLAKKEGICFDYASLFVAMARSQGIPARLVIGYADPEIYHAWNEVYTEETGWITPELLLSEKGFNLVDATFYAGSDNKKNIAAYISDEGNYSSLYRY